ncbi:MAG: hypothetical protein WCR30_00885 [Clostridia bacterium]
MADIFETSNRVKTQAKNAKEEMLLLSDAVLAKQIVEKAKIETKEDVFLYFSALNFLNAFVKKNYAPREFKKNYFFKNSVSKCIDAIINNNLCDCIFCYGDNVVMGEVANLQFSFHRANISDLMNKERNSNGSKYHFDYWKGIRLQPIAGFVFKEAMSLPNISKENMTILGSNNFQTENSNAKFNKLNKNNFREF